MKKKILIPLAIIGIAIFLVKSCRKTHVQTPTQTEEKKPIKDIIKKIWKDIIDAEKDIQKDIIKDTIKDIILAPDPELKKSSHFTHQPGVGFVYIDKPRLGLDVQFWRHRNFGALGGVAIDVTGRDQLVKGYIAGAYTLPFTGLQRVSIFVGTSDRALTKLDIKKAEVAVGIRIKI